MKAKLDHILIFFFECPKCKANNATGTERRKEKCFNCGEEIEISNE